MIYTEWVQPIGLPGFGFVPAPTSMTVMIGWGIYQQDPDVVPDILQEVSALVLPHFQCVDILGEDSGIHTSNICTGSDGGIGACSGDSGGPLLQWSNDDFIQIGIASWTPRPCGSPVSPTVWAGVSPFLYWIRQNCDNCV